MLCSKGYISAVNTLLKRRVSCNAFNKVIVTVLAYLFPIEFAYHLSTLCQDESSCLVGAMVGGHYSVVELLLQNGADISTTSSKVTIYLNAIWKVRNLIAASNLKQGEGSSAKAVPESIRQLLDRTHQVDLCWKQTDSDNHRFEVYMYV